PVHADARRGKAARLGGNKRHVRRVSSQQTDARRIPGAGQRQKVLTSWRRAKVTFLRGHAARAGDCRTLYRYTSAASGLWLRRKTPTCSLHFGKSLRESFLRE